jgi:hypothetical protein
MCALISAYVDIETSDRQVHPFQRLPTNARIEASKEVAIAILYGSRMEAEA